jgi:serine/threonine-protein kinase PpkA
LEEHLQSVLRRQRSRQAKARHADKRARSGARSPRRHWQDRPNTAVRPTIPRYTLLRQLADSSRAEVWLANSDALQRVVALKISKVEPGDAEDTALFAREYAAIAAISHPGVVDIFDYGVHNGHEFLAMEYFPAGDLKQRLQKPISESECLIYLQRIASALQPVHLAGMMHLDLKPPNIMLREDGSVVLIDFGLVKRMGSIAGSTMMGVRRGSPYYMSPEQVHGLPLDPRSDIYSLGVVFYEMLTGRRPFVGTSAIELMDSHVKGQRPELPSGLAAYEPLLDAMMATNREQRLADASALLELLQSPAYNPYSQEEIEAPAVAHA